MRRPTASVLVLGAVLASTAVGAPAAAAPGCSNPVRPGPVVSQVPWQQKLFGPDRVWRFSRGGGVTVAVIDSGSDDDHPQLRNAMVPGRDLLDPGADGTLDCVSHGTAVASLIAARPVDGVGFRGLAPDAKIMPIRITDQEPGAEPGSGNTVSETGLAEAIDDAVQADVKIINLSLVLYRDDPEVRAAIKRAVAANVLVVAAAGNGHKDGQPDQTPYPAAYDGVIGVGAIGPNGQLLAASQIGPYVDLVAPGDQVLAATRVSGHAIVSGTSFATPLVAATAALVWAASPTLSAADVARQVITTADPGAGAPDAGFGAGVVDPYRAVTERLADGRTGALGTPLSPPPQPTGLDDDRPATPIVALWIALAGLAVLIGLGVAAVIVPRGRRHGWRAERPAPVASTKETAEPVGNPEDLFGPVKR
ncbi:type VII secretion-associated serine protease mycosin [Cryptosporangium phraense]|uniref:Type VII secretion-associated serine protease mycosin n=1 Tax=Cryptosporangium phraense TaxID=2593070 RepID=A0A545AR60_9ACTN|nr:type VII secretion-associated serine protease mycosin [Cryptosporangium phraense]TQS43819.1 type VII secretion-associated serine protease mycosin [Cryptosporangium phraense]